MPQCIVLYGGAVMENGTLNPDTVGRCEAALRIARRCHDPYIVYTVGPAIPRLAETTIAYLMRRGWRGERLLLNPQAHNSLTETRAAIEVLCGRGIHEVIFVTSWYHVPRVWMIWRLLFTGRVRFVVAWETACLVRSLVWEILGFPKTLAAIVRGWLCGFSTTTVA